METFLVKLELELEVEAFDSGDARDVACDMVYEMEGFGVSIVNIRSVE